MTPTRLEQEYYVWLVSQIALPTNGSIFHELLSRMHSTEFLWNGDHAVAGDHNRIEDARELRREFVGDRKIHVIPSGDGVSFLEVLIGLSRRTSYADGEQDSPWWAWKLIKNIRLNRMIDPLSERQVHRIDLILEAVVWRTYREDGLGGFFPLKNPKHDQTKVEIWYQMNAYLIEIEHP